MFQDLEGDAALVAPSLREWWQGYLRAHQQRYLDLLGFLEEQNLTEDPAVLEIGSAPGHLTAVLQKIGYALQGVDIAPERMDRFWQKHGLTVTRLDVEQEPWPFEDAAFDLVLFNEILEHLRINPLHALSESARVLRPGGKLLLSTPNITPLHRFHFLLGQDYQGNPVEEFKKLEELGHMGHIRLYSVPEIKAFLQEAGLEVGAVRVGGELLKPGWKATALLFLRYPNWDYFRRFVYVWASKPRTIPK